MLSIVSQEDNLDKDKRWLEDHFDKYQRRTRTVARRRDAPDRLTFPTYMLKLYAPNVPASNMLCDGLGLCQVSQTCIVIHQESLKLCTGSKLPWYWLRIRFERETSRHVVLRIRVRSRLRLPRYERSYSGPLSPYSRGH
jgi:hypothetical protein